MPAFTIHLTPNLPTQALQRGVNVPLPTFNKVSELRKEDKLHSFTAENSYTSELLRFL